MRQDVEFLSKDRTKLIASLWDANSHQWLLWIHGFAEHRLRYENFANFLYEHQISFFIFDLRGHGDSEGKRGLILDFQEYLNDVEAAIQFLSTKTKKIHIGGHSMGGLILGRYLETRNPPIEIKSAILTCPFIGLGMPVPGWKRFLGNLLSKPLPGLLLPSGLDPEKLSHDKHVVESYKNDPKVFKHATARWFAECLKHQELVVKEASNIRIPTLVLQGLSDEIVDPQAAKTFYENLTTEKRWIGYERLYHEILNEIQEERQKVYQDILKWIKK
ncbi:MAG: lysophospholipase [Leptospiraceae bacterium]|nr:lysophospholipase [Leptospiraceae bacterium]MDW7976152.1 alpha/beta hydrolase [Leptospiraceae bacterium]